MPLFALRMRDGNCLIIAADTQSDALNRAHAFRREDAIVSCRQINNFVAEFILTDGGELKAELQEAATLRDLHTHEYPMLAAALTQSFADFESSATDSRTEPVLFDQEAQAHIESWGQRDHDIVGFAVQQERQRFSN